ncbi:hypothetical protein MJO29_011651 [Puccinia striiformis f. sp. tritici]|nr:hypothetical protein MJO29_011651 [Puccinia striiformis f. sp. tritici]
MVLHSIRAFLIVPSTNLHHDESETDGRILALSTIEKWQQNSMSIRMDVFTSHVYNLSASSMFHRIVGVSTNFVGEDCPASSPSGEKPGTGCFLLVPTHMNPKLKERDQKIYASSRAPDTLAT